MYSIATYRISTDNKAEDLSSKDFFDPNKNNEEDLFKWRHAIQRGEKHLYCGLCGKPLRICGGGNGENKQQLHFRHKFKHDAECCGYNENEKSLTRRQIELKKFANEEESKLHRQLKFLIADTLENNGAETRIERYIVDEKDYHNRRRPDIRAIFPNKDMAIEVQITSTFMDVILGREDFYAAHNMFLLWVINEFRPDLFHQKDIIYSNKSQAFVLDEEARIRTEKEGKLYLKCYYKSYFCNHLGDIVEHPTYKHDLITFEDLIFDKTDYSVYYFNAEENKQQCEKEQKIILKRIYEEQERRRKVQEAIRRKQEEEEREAQRQYQLEQMRWQEEQERLQKESEERKQKEAAECKERERVSAIKTAQRLKIEDYVYHDTLSAEEYWLHYQQLNEEERQYADAQIHDMIISSVCHSYLYYYHNRQYQSDKRVAELYVFLWQHKYHFDWHKLEDIPEVYFTRPKHDINRTLYEYITFYLYIHRNYRLPNQANYINQIYQDFNRIIKASQDNEDPYYASAFDDTQMILLCFERLGDSSFANNKEVYRLVYEKRDIIRHLYSIYLGELVGKDYNEDRHYRPFFIELASPYYHLYKRMMECRRKLFKNHGLVPNMFISLIEIERGIHNAGITPNNELDALMPILFPDIPWELQQTLF